MTTYDVVRKLIGKVEPIGETNEDNIRFENLKELISLVDNLLIDIDDLEYKHKNSSQFSVKRAAELASKFLDKIGIKE